LNRADSNMTIGTLWRNRVGRWLLGFAFWTLLGLSFASQFYISSAKAGLEVTWVQAVSYALGDWYVFAFLSLAVMPLARRFHFESGRWPLSFAVHGVASVLFSLAYMVLRAWVGEWQSGAGFWEAFKPLAVKTWHFNLMIYWVIVAVGQAFGYYRKYRDRELHAAELEKVLVQAKLRALQMQLNPHFLFNTLHSISSLMHQDVEAADRMLARLSELLRATLESSDAQEVPLRRELEVLKLYLSIEQIRFGQRLAIRMDVASDTLDAQVPNLILQPLVENAIRHGIEPHKRPGLIELRARRRNGDLTLEICDNGIGLKGDRPLREGVGLSNSRARLRELYGPAHGFELNQNPEGGLRIEVRIPFHSESQDNEDSNIDRGR
jgi:two-component system, LytTR family, sensor kinase